MVVLEDPAGLAGVEAGGDAILHDPLHHHHVDAGAAVLLGDAEGQHADRGGGAQLAEELPPAEREQPAAARVHRLVDVRQRHQEADRFAVDLGDLQQGRVRDLLQVARLGQELVLGHRHEPPVAFPDLLVETPHDAHVALEVAHVDTPDRRRVALLQVLGDAGHALAIDADAGPAQRDQVLGLLEPERLEPAGVVRRIVRHHHHRLARVAFDQQPAAVVGRQVDRAAQFGGAALPAPSGGVGQELGRGVGVARFEVAEEADPIAVELVVQPVPAGADAARAAAVAPGAEEAGLGVPEERVLARVDLPLLPGGERRHEMGIAAVEAALQFEEPAGVRLGPDRRARTQVFCGGTHPDRR